VETGAKKKGDEADDRPRYTFHTLRLVAASHFIEQGWTPKKIQTVMGHSSIQVTFDTYGHVWEDTEGDQKAVAQLEARLFRIT
jgi:integrase